MPFFKERLKSLEMSHPITVANSDSGQSTNCSEQYDRTYLHTSTDLSVRISVRILLDMSSTYQKSVFVRFCTYFSIFLPPKKLITPKSMCKVPTVRLGKVEVPHLVHQNRCKIHRIFLSVHKCAIATLCRYGTVQSVGP